MQRAYTRMYAEELQKACVENAFAIKSYCLEESSALAARVMVVTLEQRELAVTLDKDGYKVCHPNGHGCSKCAA